MCKFVFTTTRTRIPVTGARSIVNAALHQFTVEEEYAELTAGDAQMKKN